MSNDFPKVIPPNPANMTQQEIDTLIANLRDIELRAWGEEMAFTEDHLRSHIRVFPEGILTAYFSESESTIYHPNAWGMVQIMRYDISRPIETWYGATDDGFIEKTFDPEGNMLYGVNLSVPYGNSSLITKTIIDAAKDLVILKKLEGLVLGARIPRYHRYSHLKVEKYILEKRGKRRLDPEIARYESYGFEIATARDGKMKILPNYFNDPESLNYGILLVWNNHGGVSI